MKRRSVQVNDKFLNPSSSPPRLRSNTLRTSDNAAEKSTSAYYRRSRASYPSRTEISEMRIFNNSKSIFNQPQRLWLFISRLLSITLEDTRIQLQCLNKCNNELKIIKTMAELDQLKKIKYDVNAAPETGDASSMSKEEMNSTVNKVRKLEDDRKYVNNVIEEMYMELTLHQTFHLLQESNKEIIRREEYRNALQIKEARNKLARKEVIKQVRQQRNHNKSTLYHTQATIEVLRAKVEDSLLLSETCYRYIQKWQEARTEQNDKTIAVNESNPATNINYYKQRSDHEHRVHSEVELLVNIVIEESLAKIEQWMEKYDNDLEAIDLQIQIRQNDYNDMRDKRMAMEAQLEDRDKLMKDWINFKIERENARLYHEKMTKAATAVQAWWRGLIVRLKLGPFKEGKGRKGKKHKK